MAQISHSQNGIQDTSKGVKVSVAGGNLIGSGFNNSEIKTSGSVYFHQKWLLTTFNKQKIRVKYHAFNGEMHISSGQKILPLNGLRLTLENGETWIAFQKSWYRLIRSKQGETFLHKPYVEYKPRKTAQSGYEVDKPAEYRLKHSFFAWQGDKITLLSRKQVKKMELHKLKGTQSIQ